MIDETVVRAMLVELQNALDELRRAIERATVEFVQRMEQIDESFDGREASVEDEQQP